MSTLLTRIARLSDDELRAIPTDELIAIARQLAKEGRELQNETQAVRDRIARWEAERER